MTKKGRPYIGQAEDLSTIVSLEEELVTLGKENFGIINKTLGLTTDLAKISKTITEEGKLQEGISKDKVKNLIDELETNEKIRDAIMETAPGVFEIAAGAKKGLANFKLMAKSTLGIVAIAGLAVKAFTEFQEAVTPQDLKAAIADEKYWKNGGDPAHIAKVRQMSAQIARQKTNVN